MRSSRTSCSRCRTRSTSGAARACALLLALGALLARPADGSGATPAAAEAVADGEEPADGAGQARFEAALRLLSSGQAGAAATALSALAHERPEDDVAPEALFEAAQLYEEQLGEPEKARMLYRTLVEQYPASRLLRRAQHRLAQLETGLRTGAAPLQQFQQILRTTTEASPPRIAALRALLAAQPDFALADQALYLLGGAELRAGDAGAAAATFAALYRRFPASEWAAQARKTEAEAHLSGRRFAAARASYQALARFSGPLWPETAAEGLETTQRLARQWLASLVAAAIAALVFVVGVLRGRYALWPPPLEVKYFAPVAAFFVALGIGVQGGSLAPPIVSLGFGGLLLCWLSAALLRQAAEERAAAETPPGRLATVLGFTWGALWRIAAAAALAYLIVYHHGLIDLVTETLKNGPDSD